MITLAILMIFSVTWLGGPMPWNHAVGFGFIVLGAWFVFQRF